MRMLVKQLRTVVNRCLSGVIIKVPIGTFIFDFMGWYCYIF